MSSQCISLCHLDKVIVCYLPYFRRQLMVRVLPNMGHMSAVLHCFLLTVWQLSRPAWQQRWSRMHGVCMARTAGNSVDASKWAFGPAPAMAGQLHLFIWRLSACLQGSCLLARQLLALSKVAEDMLVSPASPSSPYHITVEVVAKLPAVQHSLPCESILERRYTPASTLSTVTVVP